MKKYKIYEENDNHEFNLMVYESSDETTYVLGRSNANHWTTPREIILSAVDHGNGVKFSKRYKADMNYSDFCEMHVLMSFIVKHQKGAMMPVYTIIEEVELGKI